MSTMPGSALETSGAVFHPCLPDETCCYCNGSMRPEESLDWSFLGAIYCISLKNRDDRAVAVATEFHRLGLCQKVIFYRPDKHPGKGIIGSWESHRAVGMHALQKGCKNTLIMEDDVVFVHRLTPPRVRAISHALDNLPKGWMIFFLGHWPIHAYFIRHNVLRTHSVCAHAYIASPFLLQWLRDHPWGSPGVRKLRIVGRALDSAYAELPGGYALFPMIATQIASKSDNANFKHKRIRRLKHLVTHSKYRELMLSKLMRPAEIIVAMISPVFFIISLLSRLRSRFIVPK